MNTFLKTFVFLTSLYAVSTALNCTNCNGNGTECWSQGQSKLCEEQDALCSRATFFQNGLQKVIEGCLLKEYCVGSIDCDKQGFELGNTFQDATKCVVSCCKGDNCIPPKPLKCYQCQDKGKTCKTNIVSCGYEEDRCLRINYNDGSDLMTDQRCYQSSKCSNKSEICGFVRNEDCTHSCWNNDYCNAVVGPDPVHGHARPNYIPCSFLVGLLLVSAPKM